MLTSAVRPAFRGALARAARPVLAQPAQQARGLAKNASGDAFAPMDVNQKAIFERLVREDSALIDATVGAAEALSASGAEAPAFDDMLEMSNTSAGLKSSLAYTKMSLDRAMTVADPCLLKREPVRVAITGPAGAIGYSMVFRVASGEMLGPHQPVILQLVEIPAMMDKLQGVVMELKDCAFPLVAGIETTADVNAVFANADYALLVGSKPRGPGM